MFETNAVNKQKKGAEFGATFYRKYCISDASKSAQFKRHTQVITGYFGNESFQAISCTGTDNSCHHHVKHAKQFAFAPEKLDGLINCSYKNRHLCI